jgi:UDP-N-acetylglucosamine 2-epimerase (non-hydrolysing)
MKKILIVVGTRPNYIKVTRFKSIAKQQYPERFEIKILHTGQHYSPEMSDIFFQQFDLEPDYFLRISPGNVNIQMAEIISKVDAVLNEWKPDLVIVPGDVNTTLAAALAAHKAGFKLAHLESGLRSFDRTMPEEINRILTDEISDLFFVTERSGEENLLKEGKSKEKIFMVGNTMIDTFVAFLPKIREQNVIEKLGLKEGNFVIMTMHRPATVDSSEGLRKLVAIIKLITADYKLVFPIHPRTVNKLKEEGLYDDLENISNLILSQPLDYLSFQKLISACSFVVTDSGGIQEETTYMQKPCLTLRPNTERPVTVDVGSNLLIPFEVDILKDKIEDIRNGLHKKGEIPPLWDGHSTERIFEVLDKVL